MSIGPIHIRQDLEAAQDQVTAFCARESAVPRTITVDIKGRPTGDLLGASFEPSIEITTTSDDPFAQCFVDQAMQNRRPVSFIARGFGSSATLTLTPPDRILARAIDAWLAENGCRPSPGPIPTSIAIDITSDDVEMTVKVAVTPANATLDACELKSLNAMLLDARIDTGLWKPTVHVKRKLTPIVTNANLREMTASYGSHAVASCIPGDIAAPIDEAVANGEDPARLGTMSISARAKRDGDISVVVRSGDKTRDACTTAALTKMLHEHYEQRFGDGTTYFRIDGNAAANLRLPIKTQGQLDAFEATLRAR